MTNLAVKPRHVAIDDDFSFVVAYESADLSYSNSRNVLSLVVAIRPRGQPSGYCAS